MAAFERSVVILYVIQNETVWITNVFAGSRDYAALLGNQPLQVNDNYPPSSICRAISASFRTVFKFRAVPAFNAGSFSFDLPEPLGKWM
jgi:hypothetical protein